MKYSPEKIEKKWQKKWLEAKVYFADDKSEKPKKYILMEFPYPSAAGLHAGHLRGYAAGDVISRFYRAKGFNVMYPIGWDAFGLPAENYAIKMGVQPDVSTKENIKNAKRQFNSWGMSFDWGREINTTDPEYYKWTQWIFLQFYKKGLAYEAEAAINWCPKDKTGLANEEVIDGKCERCGTPVEKKFMRQWFLKITDYAEKLLQGLETLDWPSHVKAQQANWIGKSAGAEIDFEVIYPDGAENVTVFTTRPDTLFGATYLVLAPEHPLVEKVLNQVEDSKKVIDYVAKAKSESDIQRSSNAEKEKTGVALKGVAAINPATGEQIPVWVADYVLGNYGSGAIMAVPAHDERDKQFAEKYNLPIKVVVENDKLVNSGEFDGKDIESAKNELATKFGRAKVTYRLRDWVFSRQRYWGEPIPIIHCEKCGIVPVREEDLPVKLPKVDKYEPTGTGESPLAAIDSWVNVKCPKCDDPAKRETNTMPQWAGSSWYFLRYADPENKKSFADPEKLKYWMPIDIYFGGMEHTTLHLLYSRFWNQFLFDQGLVPTSEPYSMRQPHGIVLGPDGEKMSKSRGNVVNPDDILSQYGADTLRMFEMFLGPHEQFVAWNDNGAIGVNRFLQRVWNFGAAHLKSNFAQTDSAENVVLINRLIKKIGEDLEGVRFNTCISSLMEFVNQVGDQSVTEDLMQKFLIVLSPFAPHIAEELWSELGFKGFVVQAQWPEFDPAKIESDTVKMVAQVAGKMRGTFEIKKDATQEEVEAAARQMDTVIKSLGDSKVAKVVFVPNRLINFVI